MPKVIVLVLLLTLMLARAASSEVKVDEDCKIAVPPGTGPVQADLVAAAKEVTGYEGELRAPALVVAEFASLGDGLAIAGCFDARTWAVQITPRAEGPLREFFLLHELTHAVLETMGVKDDDQHCVMAMNNTAVRIFGWLLLHGRGFDPRQVRRMISMEGYYCGG